MGTLGALLGAYLLGAIPFGYLITLASKKVDIRTVGSGHTGGTNVVRVAGALPGALTIIADFCKGWAAVALARSLAPTSVWTHVLAGILAIVGHNYSVFLGFRGGVGTMATLGAGIALLPWATVASAAVGMVALVVWRYASLGSLLVAGLLPLFSGIGAALGAWSWPNVLFGLASGLLSAWGLRANIARLRAGTERKFGQRVPLPPEH